MLFCNDIRFADETVPIALITEGTGYVYMDCVQLEQAATASRYNLIEGTRGRFSCPLRKGIKGKGNSLPEGQGDGSPVLHENE